MKIRNKILIYFSTTVIALTGISLTIIYVLFYEYREEEFQQQQNKKIRATIKLVEKFKQESSVISYFLDKQDINDFYDEKMFIYDENKNIIFKSLDSLDILKSEKIVSKLSPNNQWIETKEDNYDLIGIYLENENKKYYAVSKAYDAFGYDKLSFLQNVLIKIFICTFFVVLYVSYYISRKVSKPITQLAESLVKFDIKGENIKELMVEKSSYELMQLTQKFNNLLRRTNEAFIFQKHSIHHISHELKTPIAVLVSELEKIKNYSNIEKIKLKIDNQVIKAKSLGEIINVLLEISKIESGQQIRKQAIRMDELIFDSIEELKIIYPNFHFEVNYIPANINENRLVINFNYTLIKQVIQNLLSNCILHSSNLKANIKFNCASEHELKIQFLNTGKPILEEERKFLFNRFFRGNNSQGKSGSGLGLVLTKKILDLNKATITYSNDVNDLNVFEITLPLS